VNKYSSIKITVRMVSLHRKFDIDIFYQLLFRIPSVQFDLTAPCNPAGNDNEQEFMLSILPFTLIILMNTRTEDLKCYSCNNYGTAIVVLPIMIERMRNLT
jgi:hypothetical protein